MTEYISSQIVKRLLKWGLISLEQKEDYHYELEVMIEKIVGFTILLVLSIFQNVCFYTILFWICFSLLRRYTGGFHAKSFLGCLGVSVITYEVYVWIFHPFLMERPRVLWLVLLISLILILCIGTVNHPDMQLNDDEYRLCKRWARVIGIIQMLTMVACSMLGVNLSYIGFMGFGMSLCAGMLLFAKLIKQEADVTPRKGVAYERKVREKGPEGS